MSDEYFNRDSWNHAKPKLPQVEKPKLGPLRDILPFAGYREPTGRSAVSQRMQFLYRTAADNWQPRIGACESGGELACAHMLLLRPDLYDLVFQANPIELPSKGSKPNFHFPDLLATYRNGHRRIFYVKNGQSLTRTETKAEIASLRAMLAPSYADTLVVVNTDMFSRQRKENLIRLHEAHFSRTSEDEAIDAEVLDAIRSTPLFSRMTDLYGRIDLPEAAIFRSCYRLVARGSLKANLDHLLWEHARLELAA